MIGFIYNNQALFTALFFVGILFALYFSAKNIPTKVNKKVKAKENVKEKVEVSTTDSTEEIKEEFDKSELLVRTEEVEQNDEKSSKKPKIVQVYKRRERTESGNQTNKQEFDPIYNRDVEFVNTSKNIAKFKSFAEVVEKDESEPVEKDEFGFVTNEDKDCEFCTDKVKHFDHSKRLSSIMKEEEDLFNSHISEKYLNINAEKHLKIDKVEESLFKRTSEMLLNSEDRVISEHEHNYDCECEDGCECVEDDDVKINMKTALIADTYFNRKKRK